MRARSTEIGICPNASSATVSAAKLTCPYLSVRQQRRRHIPCEVVQRVGCCARKIECCCVRKMEKNPVSFLQEHTMQRLKETPIYTVISQNVGTHINSFNIRVSCNGFSAEGVGSSKKEAKLQAAMKMIDLMKIKQPQSSLSSTPLNTSISSILNSSSSSSLTPPSSPSKSPASLGINYVGKLQEFAANQINGFLPQYELVGACGPSHNPEFTFVCKYQGHSVTAKGSSKKEAKSLVAQRMYEKVAERASELKVVLPETEVNGYIETVTKGLEQVKIFECNKKMMEDSVKKALTSYPKLTTTVVSTPTVPDKTFANYYKLLKSTISPRDRELVIDKLHDTMEACKSYLSFDNRRTNPMAILKIALKSINVNVKGVEYKTKSNHFIYSLMLETQPVINEIACGETRIEAEVTATFLIAKTLTIMLC